MVGNRQQQLRLDAVGLQQAAVDGKWAMVALAEEQVEQVYSESPWDAFSTNFRQT